MGYTLAKAMESPKKFMQRALELAGLGLGSVGKNPMVGCVITHENEIIGEGYYQKFGGAHAEVNAIAAVKDETLLAKSTAYVTLEPCSIFGKTPPCTDLLIKKKIPRVVVACIDPNASINGNGIRRLTESGVEVQVGVLNKEARELNNRFFTFHQKKRPYVILKWAQTTDGFIARENFDSKWITNKYSRQLVHKWRAEEDAILVGKNTALYDNPSLTTRAWHGKNPTRILLDSQLQIDKQNNLFNDEANTLAFNQLREGEEKSNKWIRVNNEDPKAILSVLQKEGVLSIIVEGGAKVLKSFVDSNFWDEARVFTGNENFKNGISAPLIDGTVIHQERIFEDHLTIYKNQNG